MAFEATLHVLIWSLKCEMESREEQNKWAENVINMAQI